MNLKQENRQLKKNLLGKSFTKTSYLTQKDFMDIWNDKIITSIDFINSPELHNNRSFYQLINNAVCSGFNICKSKTENQLKEQRKKIEDSFEKDKWTICDSVSQINSIGKWLKSLLEDDEE